MDYVWIVPLLALGTMLTFLIYALLGKAAIEERKDDSSIPKSTLAKDGPQGGVSFLVGRQGVPQRGATAEPVLG